MHLRISSARCLVSVISSPVGSGFASQGRQSCTAGTAAKMIPRMVPILYHNRLVVASEVRSSRWCYDRTFNLVGSWKLSETRPTTGPRPGNPPIRNTGPTYKRCFYGSGTRKLCNAQVEAKRALRTRALANETRSHTRVQTAHHTSTAITPKVCLQCGASTSRSRKRAADSYPGGH